MTVVEIQGLVKKDIVRSLSNCASLAATSGHRSAFLHYGRLRRVVLHVIAVVLVLIIVFIIFVVLDVQVEIVRDHRPDLNLPLDPFDLLLPLALLLPASVMAAAMVVVVVAGDADLSRSILAPRLFAQIFVHLVAVLK